MRRLISSALLTGALAAFAASPARAQEAQPPDAQEAKSPPRVAAEKIDEYGALGHCDMTSRLDFLAMELQNDSRLKAYLISYDAAEKKGEYANHSLSTSRHYLIHQRGIDAARVQVVNGGRREGVERVHTELWLVPEGATPPFQAPEKDKYSDTRFSGKFDVYSTDDRAYMEWVEMGWSKEGIARSEFAEKMKQQPESVGYLVVRPSKTAAPGAFRRIARRDETILTKDYGIESARLKSVYGGEAEGEYSSVELWVLPKSAPPPQGAPERPAARRETAAPATAFQLNVYEANEMQHENAEGWMLENLAEALRADPRAVAHLVVRESPTVEVSEEETPETTPQSETPQASDETAASSEASTSEASAPEAASAEATEEAESDPSLAEMAERWKKALVEKYGVEGRRIVVAVGRPRQWGSGTLTTWVVPEKAQAPDPFALDEGELEEEVIQEEAEPTEDATPQTPPRFDR
ncbi:MAG TPA: hypothetical protein VGV59_19740 [Pyrinomonadaceae bacterium]|nr:hypothetical protein [Pyrinomonadaceae bacterium]